MRRALTAAMKARDQPAVTALRSALAAIDNAEAVDTARATPTAEGHPAVAGEIVGGRIPDREIVAGEIPAREVVAGEVAGGEVAGAVIGLGAAEVERRTLTSAEMEAIVREEVAERQTAARTYERAGQPEHVERLRAEAEVLSAYLGDPGGDLGDPGVDLGDSGVDLGDPGA